MASHDDGPPTPSEHLGILARWMTSEPPPPMTATGGTHLSMTSSPKRASSRLLRWPSQKPCQRPLLMCGHRHGRPSKWTAKIKWRAHAALRKRDGDSWRRINDAPAVSACGRRSNHGRSTPWIASSIFCKPSPSRRARQEPSSSCGGRSRTCRTSREMKKARWRPGPKSMPPRRPRTLNRKRAPLVHPHLSAIITATPALAQSHQESEQASLSAPI